MFNQLQDQSQRLASFAHDQSIDCQQLEDAAFSGASHAIPFPWKLHEMLEAADVQGFDSVVSWLPDNNSFKVHNQQAFVSQVMPRFFKQSMYKSFQRQLNMWGFDRLTTAGPGRGGYSHESFVRGNPSLCRHMKRLKIKGTGPKRDTSPKTTTTTTVTSTLAHLQPVLTGSLFQNELAQQQFPLPQSINNAEPSLFDDATLMEVLSTAVENTNQLEPNAFAPQDGDCLLFEGRNFFFVEDYTSGNKQERRVSIDMRSPGQKQPRRFSLTTNNPLKQPVNVVRPSRRFSLERASVHQAISTSPNVSKQSRRFSLELATSASQQQEYILKELLEQTIGGDILTL